METDDISLRGQYQVGLWVYFEDYPEDAYLQNPDPIVITLANSNCDFAIVTGVALQDQEYTIGEAGVDYEMPQFEVDLLGCGLIYSFTIDG